MRGAEFLHVLPLLAVSESEASLRTQIGRLYYAVYLESRQWCEWHLGYLRQRNAREHAEVQRLLHSMDPKLVESLSFLRAYRNTADYDMEVSPETLVKQFADAVDRSEQVLAALATLSPPGSSNPEPTDAGDE